jgi:uncharacterized phosphosugar-binding protein
MEIIENYYENIVNIIKNIKDNEMDHIQEAANILADVIENDELIYIFGTGGHSIIGGMEIFHRAGGLVPINAMFPPGVSAMEKPSTERLEGYASLILKHYGLKKNDVIIISNVNGINTLTIEAALESRKIGSKIIAITSRDFANSVPKDLPARHHSNKNLHELGDIVIDLHVPYGDAVLKLDNFEQKIGPSSTLAVCFALNSLSATVVAELLRRGLNPPVWRSANVEGGDQYNKQYIEKYITRIPHLSRS